jgi:predicted nucleic acid-binding protein
MAILLLDTTVSVDVTIAAVALTHGLTLLTDNRKDFPMPELALYSLP